MTTTTYILILLLIITLFAIICERRKRRYINQIKDQELLELESYKRITSIIFQNVHAFILLIDKNFVVKRTNYYTQTKTLRTFQEKKVGDLLRCSNAMSAINGCGTHELCAKCPIRHAIQNAFDTKKDFTDLEGTLNTLDDSRNSLSEFDALISGSYITIKNQEYMILTIHDVTTLKQAQRSLIEAREKAEDSSRAKSAFLANMSHEIRTPLNAIIGFAEVLANAKTDEEKKQFQEIVQSNGNLLLQLVNDILDISKIEAGTLEFNYSDVDINVLLSDLQQLFTMKLKGQNSNVQIVLQKGLPECVIKTDNNRLSQVISNFISNAIKYTSEGEITVGYEKRDSELYFFVKDTGTGIPESKLPKLFDRFYRADKTKEGTGLGLSICKTIIDKLNGNIGVESILGQGSTFWFTLPYNQSEE
jgi:signal transduction histidine kinase